MHKFAFLLLLFFSNALFAASAVTQKKSQLSQVGREIGQLQQKMTLDRKQQAALMQQLKNSETTLSQLAEETRALNKTIDQEKSHLQQLQSSLHLTSLQLAKQQESLANQIRSVYKLSQIDSLKILLNQDDPTLVARHLAYNRYLGEARLLIIADVKKTWETLNRDLQPLLQQKKKLEALIAKKEQQHAAQSVAQEKRKKLLSKLHQSMETKEERLKNLIANQQALQNIVQNLQKKSILTLSDTAFKEQQGKLHWPVSGKIAARYGSTLESTDQHLTGVIIQAVAGTPVKAIYQGKVIFASWLRGFGLLIIVSHGQNYLSLYGRNDALYAKPGDYVNTGDVIASTGNSGGFTQSGLYFEIRKNGIPVNPAPWF